MSQKLKFITLKYSSSAERKNGKLLKYIPCGDELHKWYNFQQVNCPDTFPLPLTSIFAVIRELGSRESTVYTSAEGNELPLHFCHFQQTRCFFGMEHLELPKQLLLEVYTLWADWIRWTGKYKDQERYVLWTLRKFPYVESETEEGIIGLMNSPTLQNMSKEETSWLMVRKDTKLPACVQQNTDFCDFIENHEGPLSELVQGALRLVMRCRSRMSLYLFRWFQGLQKGLGDRLKAWESFSLIF